MFCRKCGKEIPDDSEFCYKCGARVVSIDDNSEQVSPSAPAENVVERAAENPKISLDKPDSAEKQEGNSDIEVTSCRCYFCGEEMFSNQEKCSRCCAPNPEFDKIHFTSPEVESKSNTVSEISNNSNQPEPNVTSRVSQTVTPQLPKKCPICGKPVVPHRESCPYCGGDYNEARGMQNEKLKTEERYEKVREISYFIGWCLVLLWYLVVGGISGFWELMKDFGGFIIFVSFLILYSWGLAAIIIIRKIILCVMCVTKFEPRFRMEHEQRSGIGYIVTSISLFIIIGPMCGSCRDDVEATMDVALHLAIPLLFIAITSFICYGVLKKASEKRNNTNTTR